MALIYLGGVTGMVVNEKFGQVVSRMQSPEMRDAFGFIVLTQPLEGPTFIRVEAITAIAPGKDENKEITAALAVVETNEGEAA